jgi:hypothetical protein
MRVAVSDSARKDESFPPMIEQEKKMVARKAGLPFPGAVTDAEAH